MGVVGRVVWVGGELVVGLAIAVGVAWAKDYRIASLIAMGLLIAALLSNWLLLRGIEARMEHRLLVKSSRKLPVAANTAALLGLLVPAGDLFDDDLGWLLMVVLLVAAMIVLQLVKATPPGLFLLAAGYRPQKVEIAAGSVDVWARGKSRLGPGDVVKAVETEQALWLGTVLDA